MNDHFSLASAEGLLLLLAIPWLWYIGWPRQNFRRRRDIASLILRSFILLLLVLALAGLESRRSTDQLAVVFVVDRSDSMGADAGHQAEIYIREAIETMAADDRFGVVVFGREAIIERPISATRALAPLRSEVNGDHSDLAKALRKALSIFPPDAARRIVLFSDGQETSGDATHVAQIARSANVEISHVHFQRTAIPDLRLTRFDLPAIVGAGQDFTAEITILADLSTRARLHIGSETRRYFSEIISLQAGRNQLSLTLESDEVPGNHLRLEASVEALEPAFRNPGYVYQNDRLAGVARVVGEPTVLLVHPDASETLNLLPALESTGLQIQQMPTEGLPNELSGYLPYDAVVMVNVSALEITEQRLLALETYVRDYGGGLVLIGGEDAYAPGGYADSPLERALPLAMRLRDEQRLPQINIIYIIDHSGSMGSIGAGGEGLTNLQYAQEAIVRSLDYLQSEDRAAIIGFDASAFLVSPFQRVEEALSLELPVLSLRASGGTDILAGMSLAAEIAPLSQTDLTHIILLTDGGANDEGLVELAENLKETAAVSTSVVSIGREPVPFLQAMAQAGGGQFHHIANAASIPAIFAAETILATRSYIFEEPIQLRALLGGHPILRDLDHYPNLNGYVATSAKETASVLMRGGPHDDPILAAWQYGLGRTVAFTSDAKAQWASEWVVWDDFAVFWDQALRWSITRDSQFLETRVIAEATEARIVTEARDNEGDFLNGLHLEATVNYPKGSTQEFSQIPLEQVAPGRYEALFQPGQEGAHLLLVKSMSNEDVWQSRSGWVHSYSEEYSPPRRPGPSLLAELATITAGQDRSAKANTVFTRDLRSEAASQPLRDGLVIVALLLLPLDIALRRLVLTREDWEWLRTHLLPRREETGAQAQIARLLAKKTPLETRRRATLAQRSAPKLAPQIQSHSPLAPQPRSVESRNLGARLLKQRRRRNRESQT